MFRETNPNPANKRVGDCSVRALCLALQQSWAETYMQLILKGYEMSDMPSANHVWGSLLRDKGFTRQTVPDSCPDCYSVSAFASEHPQGTYILALSGHVVCLKDGDWLDTWDSADEVVLYYWERSN